jgi:hypothetical protein
MDPTPVLEGGCLCGHVRYRALGPALSSSVCHCRSCRLASGAPSVAWFVVQLDRFEWLGEAPHERRSSAPVWRGFCKRCGTPLTYRHDDAPGHVELTTATLDEPASLPPTHEIWHADKLPWAASDAALPHFAGECPAPGD